VRRPLTTRVVTALAALTAVSGVGAGTARADAESQQIGIAFGTGVVTFTSIPARLEGGLAVRFGGDRAAGCAARGVCGYAGTLTWRPPHSGTLEVITYREGKKVEHEASLSLAGPFLPGPVPAPGGVATADVTSQPTGPSGPRSAYADAARMARSHWVRGR
jgi:hypothetical protein